MADSADTKQTYRSPALAWVALALAVSAWVLLMLTNGYVSLVAAVVAAVAGFLALPGRSRLARHIAVTAIIASLVLVVVITAFIIVIRITMAA